MNSTCHSCGFRSPNTAFFRREGAGLFGVGQLICEGCEPYRLQPAERRLLRSRWVGLLSSLCLAALGALLNSQPMLLVAGLLLTMSATVVVTTIVHELGHDLAARLAGLRVLAVIVGRGSRLLGWRRNGTLYEIRRYVHGSGLTRCLHEGGNISNWRSAIMIVGGPAANASAAVALLPPIWLLSRFAQGSATVVVTVVLAGMCVSQTWCALFNLLPWARSSLDGGRPSDGRRLVSLLWRRKPVSDDKLQQTAKIFQLGLVHNYSEARSECEKALRRWPQDGNFLSLTLHYVSRDAGDEAAMAFYRANEQDYLRAVEVQDGDGLKSVPWLMANISWSALKAGELPTEAIVDAYSTRALEVEPERPEMLGTRGAVLIEQGRADLGMACLIDAARRIDDPIDKADYCRFLAKGAQALGQPDRARSFEDLGRYSLARA